MAGPLIVCPSCSTHVLVRDAGCPHCGATVRSGGKVLGRTAGAMLMGLTLAGCPASDDTSETMGNGETSTTAQPTSSTTDDSGSTSFDVSTGPVGEAYGNPETTDTLGTSSGGDTDGTSSGSGSSSSGSGSDGGSTGISPDYGVPTTGE